jgi:hypothetical protein
LLLALGSFFLQPSLNPTILSWHSRSVSHYLPAWIP